MYLWINCDINCFFLCVLLPPGGRLQLTQHCHFNWKQCKADAGPPPHTSPITFPVLSRWPCIFSLKCCLCDREGTGLRADRWLRALGRCVNAKRVWWAPPAISRGANALNGFLRVQNRYLNCASLYVAAQRLSLYVPFDLCSFSDDKLFKQ